MFKILKQQFYSRSALDVAPELLGKIVHCNGISLIIQETEAYLPGDSASHAFRGRTARNRFMFGSAGTLYVYLCYGIHNLCNIVVDDVGTPAAVLLRSALVYSGEELVRNRRNGKIDLLGPGKLGQALQLFPQDSGRHLFQDIYLTNGFEPTSIICLPRVGIDYAKEQDRNACWRFVAKDFKQ